jgi:hypothetical protein
MDVNLTTTTPSLVGALKRDRKWILKRFGRSKNNNGNKAWKAKGLDKSDSSKRITYSFIYNNKKA